jgi:hypothetical protein
MVQNGKEIQYYPDSDYCVASNYPRPPRPNETPTERGTRSPNSTYTGNTNTSSYNPENSSYFFAGYNYANGLPLGVTIGGDFLYFSVNFGVGGTAGVGNTYFSLFNLEGQWPVTEWIVGLSIPLSNLLLIPMGIGANHSGPDDERVHRFVMEIGLQLVIPNFIYLMATYRLVGFKQSGFTIGAGLFFL